MSRGKRRKDNSGIDVCNRFSFLDIAQVLKDPTVQELEAACREIFTENEAELSELIQKHDKLGVAGKEVILSALEELQVISKPKDGRRSAQQLMELSQLRSDVMRFIKTHLSGKPAYNKPKKIDLSLVFTCLFMQFRMVPVIVELRNKPFGSAEQLDGMGHSMFVQYHNTLMQAHNMFNDAFNQKPKYKPRQDLVVELDFSAKEKKDKPQKKLAAMSVSTQIDHLIKSLVTDVIIDYYMRGETRKEYAIKVDPLLKTSSSSSVSSREFVKRFETDLLRAALPEQRVSFADDLFVLSDLTRQDIAILLQTLVSNVAALFDGVEDSPVEAWITEGGSKQFKVIELVGQSERRLRQYKAVWGRYAMKCLTKEDMDRVALQKQASRALQEIRDQLGKGTIIKIPKLGKGSDLFKGTTPIQEDAIEVVKGLLDELQYELIGQAEVKLKMAEFLKESMIGLSSLSEVAFNFIFGGEPGTGKTRFAKIIGVILSTMQLLDKPTQEDYEAIEAMRKTYADKNGGFGQLVRYDRTSTSKEANSPIVITNKENFIGPYEGFTEAMTVGKIYESLGRVLFIDEAYRLGEEKGYARTVLGQLLTAMTGYGKKLSIIFAGYMEKIESELFALNSGIKSRFQNIITFKSYSPLELAQIFLVSLDESDNPMRGLYAFDSKDAPKDIDVGDDLESMSPEDAKIVRDTCVLTHFFGKHRAAFAEQNARGVKNLLDGAIKQLVLTLTFDEAKQKWDNEQFPLMITYDHLERAIQHSSFKTKKIKKPKEDEEASVVELLSRVFDHIEKSKAAKTVETKEREMIQGRAYFSRASGMCGMPYRQLDLACAACGSRDVQIACATCHKVYYCSLYCQDKDSKRHAQSC
jgi:hypothetical protein